MNNRQLNSVLTIASATLVAGSITTLFVSDDQKAALAMGTIGGAIATTTLVRINGQQQKAAQAALTSALTSALQQEIHPLQQDLVSLKTQLNQLSAPAPDFHPLLQALSQELQPLHKNLNAIQAQLQTSPATPAISPGTNPALEATLAPLQKDLQALADQLQVAGLTQPPALEEQSPVLEEQPPVLEEQSSVLEEQPPAPPNGTGAITPLAETEANTPIAESVIADAAPAPSTPEKLNIKQWLVGNNCEILSHRSRSPEHPTQEADFKNIAEHLGEHYQTLGLLHAHLVEAATHPGTQVSFKVRGLPDRDRALTFCDNLYNKGMLAHFNRRKGSDTVEITAGDDHDINNFLKGVWFEYYIRRKLNVWAYGKSYDLLSNIKVEFESGRRGELDFLLTLQGVMFWLECKAGQDYRDHFEKYQDYSQLLHLPPSQALVVIKGIPESQTAQLSEKHKLTVVNEDNLITAIESRLAQLAPSSSAHAAL